MSVFVVNDSYTVVLNPDAVKLVPELRSLTQKELMYVILVADYKDSPIRTRPLVDRQQYAAKKIYKRGFDEKTMETPAVKAAMVGYRGLVFDIGREMKENLQLKLRRIQKDIFRSDISLKEVKEIDSMTQYLESRIQSIELDLERSDRQQARLKGEGKLSFIEEWQRNQMEFKKFLDSPDE